MLGGVQLKDWDGEPTFFFDTRSVNSEGMTPPLGRTPPLATETRYDHAPFELILELSDKVPSGPHNIQFFLTYYNGNEWKVDSQTVTVTVRSWVRRHERLTTIIAIVAAVFA